jgi:hypothetical protein
VSERKPVTCNACSGEVAPGIRFCWRHPTSPPKVGELVEDHGQLLWRTTASCSAKQERSLAVLLDGLQVQVRMADEVPNARPARVNLEVGNPSNTGTAATQVFVPLTSLLDALLTGDEQVEAVRLT